MAGTPPSPADTAPIRKWLIERVAYYLERPVEDIDPSVPLAESGIDSVSAANLCGDVEDRFDMEVEPTMAFDYPTVADIAAFIWTETRGA
jgi:acyl carrier protein